MQAREVFIDQVEIGPARAGATTQRIGGGDEVFLDGQVLENAPPLHHVRQPPAHQRLRGDAGGVLAVEADAAPGQGTIFQRQQVGDGLERGAFARPVAAQQGHDVPARHGQRQAAQGLHDFVVGDLDVVHFEDVIGRLGHHGIGG